MKTILLRIILLLFISSKTYAQLGIKESNAIPNAKAMLDVESSNKGVLIPRLSTTARNAIVAPPSGLMIYNSSTNHFNYWNGSVWTDFNSAALTLPFEGSGVNNTAGQAGLMKIVNTGTGGGLYVKAGSGGQLLVGQSYAGYFESSQNGVYATGGAGNLALKTAGRLELKNIGEAANKILTSTDALGNAVWQSTANLTGLQVGAAGNQITEIIKVSLSGNIGNMIAGTVGTVTFNVPGAQLGSTVLISPSINLQGGIVFSHALVEVAGSVEVKYFNAGIIDIDPPAQIFHITIIR